MTDKLIFFIIASSLRRNRFSASAETNDRLAGGTEKYKTQIKIESDGKIMWMSPAMFKSTCDINTRYFPFDDQTCKLEFGSWAFDATMLNITVNNQSGVEASVYQTNTEWELLDFNYYVVPVTYPGIDATYPKVVLKVELRRRYYYYLVNIVVPCSLIAIMVLLSFILPPEAGERVSLGITVLMAMAIFQELTSEKLPVESKFTPLLAQYYSSAIAEIGLALFATSIILNFHYQKTEMPNCLRKLIFCYIGPLVRISYKRKLPQRRLRNSKRNSANNCELKTLKMIQTENCENDLNVCENNVLEAPILEDHAIPERRDNEIDRNIPEDMEANSIEWQRAAQVLDRFILLFAVFLSVITFGIIFIQAPRVQSALLGVGQTTLESKLKLQAGR